MFEVKEEKDKDTFSIRKFTVPYGFVFCFVCWLFWFVPLKLVIKGHCFCIKRSNRNNYSKK